MAGSEGVSGLVIVVFADALTDIPFPKTPPVVVAV